jgi:hypothetical protein
MGGIGSGNWYRWNTQTTVEETKRIDICYMRKRGFLKPNTHGTLSWTCGGEPNGDINFVTHDDYLQLNFRYKEHGGEWQPIQQKIRFDYTPCHYGNSRKWFLCPRCYKRVAVLASNSPQFLCRHCNELPYSSQNEDRLDSLRRKRDKLGNRIFNDYDNGYGYKKTKGMHWKTFEVLRQQHSDIAQQYDRLFYNAFHRLTKLLNNTLI